VKALSCRQYFGLRQASGKSELDDFPAQGEIGVAIRERPDAMHVVGWNDRNRAMNPTFKPAA